MPLDLQVYEQGDGQDDQRRNQRKSRVALDFAGDTQQVAKGFREDDERGGSQTGQEQTILTTDEQHSAWVVSLRVKYSQMGRKSSAKAQQRETTGDGGRPPQRSSRGMLVAAIVAVVGLGAG